MFFYYKGMIANNRERFLTAFGKNPKEFVQKLDKIYEQDVKKYRERKIQKKAEKREPEKLLVNNYARFK